MAISSDHASDHSSDDLPDDQTEAASEVSSAGPSKAAAKAGAPAAERPRLLIIEDDADSAESLAAVLRFNGYEVRIARDSQQAVLAVDEFKPLGVMLDMGLPDLASGLHLAELLRARYGPLLVVIAVTGHTSPEQVDAATAAGVDYVLFKPLDIKRLNQMVPPVV